MPPTHLTQSGTHTCTTLHSLPTNPVQSNTVQSSPLNLIDTVDYDGGHSGNGVGTECSEVKVLNLLPLRSGGTRNTGEGSLTTTLGVAGHTTV